MEQIKTNETITVTVDIDQVAKQITEQCHLAYKAWLLIVDIIIKNNVKDFTKEEKSQLIASTPLDKSTVYKLINIASNDWILGHKDQLEHISWGTLHQATTMDDIQLIELEDKYFKDGTFEHFTRADVMEIKGMNDNAAKKPKFKIGVDSKTSSWNRQDRLTIKKAISMLDSIKGINAALPKAFDELHSLASNDEVHNV